MSVVFSVMFGCLSRMFLWLYIQAESFGTKILDEDGLLELIRTKPGKKSKYEIAAEAEVSCQMFTGVMLFMKPFCQRCSYFKFFFLLLKEWKVN